MKMMPAKPGLALVVTAWLLTALLSSLFAVEPVLSKPAADARLRRLPVPPNVSTAKMDESSQTKGPADSIIQQGSQLSVAEAVVTSDIESPKVNTFAGLTFADSNCCEFDAESTDHCGFGCDQPRPFDLTQSHVEIGVRGVLQLDAIHDFNSIGLEPTEKVLREFVTAEIPVGGEAAMRDNRTAMSPNQSLLELWVQSPTPYGKLYAYTRGNLARIPTETDFQVYMAFVTWGWGKAGLDYSLWLNRGAQPSTLDFEGPNAVPWIRYPQASLKIPFSGSTESSEHFLVLGVENAPFDATLPQSVVDRNVLNRFPTTIGKLTYETKTTQIELAGLYRRLEARGIGYRSDVNGWGGSLSGGFTTWGRDRFVMCTVIGEGIGSYNEDTDGFGLDAAPRSIGDSGLKAIPSISGWIGYEHWWTNCLRSSSTYGYVDLENGFDPTPNPFGTYQRAHYASTNLVWSPVSYVDVGIEYLYGQRRVTANTEVDGGRLGEDHRVQATIRWNFSNRP